MNRAVNIQVPEALYKQIQREAGEKSVSMAAMIRLICLEYFERQAKSGGTT